jgi:hypothetical protein
LTKPAGRGDARRALLGALLIAAIVGVGGVTFFLDDIVDAVRRQTTIVAVIEGVPNLRSGAGVWIAGRPAGRVARLELLPTQDSAALVAVRLRIPTRLRDQLRTDARVRITSARRIGEPALDILPGTPGLPAFPAGDTLVAYSGMTMQDVGQRAASLYTGIDSLTAAAAPLAGPANSRMRTLGQALVHAEAARAEFAALSAAAANGSLRLLEDPALGRAIASLRNAAGFVSTRLDATAPHRAELNEATTALRERIDRLVATLDAIDLSSENGTLARMGNDSALTRALDGVRAQIDSLIAEAKANPARFIF